jgi:hypothetical protein
MKFQSPEEAAIARLEAAVTEMRDVVVHYLMRVAETLDDIELHVGGISATDTSAIESLLGEMVQHKRPQRRGVRRRRAK